MLSSPETETDDPSLELLELEEFQPVQLELDIFDWENFVGQHFNSGEYFDDTEPGFLTDSHNESLYPLLSSTKVGEDCQCSGSMIEDTNNITSSPSNKGLEDKVLSVKKEIEFCSDEVQFFINKRFEYFPTIF